MHASRTPLRAIRARPDGRAAARHVAPPPRAEPHADATTQSARRWVVRLVVLLVLLAIGEGAIRKWVAPQWGSYIFFLRDPLLLLVYANAARHSLWPRDNPFLKLSFAMAALGVALFALQVGAGGHSEQRLILGVYGWRSYFLYAPLGFLVGAVFRREDLLRLFKLLLWLAIPIAVLVAAQFFSPQGAPINVGVSDEQEFQFKGLGLNKDHTRPMGPFASGAGQQQFVATACAILIAFFVTPRRLSQPAFTTLIATGGGVLTCIALGGSRGLVLQCALAVSIALFVGFIGRGGALKGRAFVWPAVLTVGALLAYPLLFPEGYAAFGDRWSAADAAESRTFHDTGVFGRAFFGLIDFAQLFAEVPVFGSGLGFGGNAAITLNAKIDGIAAPYSESDFARHMVDLGPVFGSAYIVFRLAFAGWLTWLAVRATRRLGDPMPLLLWSYVAYVFVMGQLTGQGSINFFGWLFAGLLIASCRDPAPPMRLHPPARARWPARRLPFQPTLKGFT